MPITTIVPVSPIVNIDVSAASKVIVLPAASTCIGTTFFLRDYKGAASTNNIFLSTNGLDRVDGQSLSSIQLRLTSTLETIKVMSLGNTAWSVIQRNKVLPSIILSCLAPSIYSIVSGLSYVDGSSYITISWVIIGKVSSYLVNDINASLSYSVANTSTTYTITKLFPATYQFTVNALSGGRNFISNTVSINFVPLFRPNSIMGIVVQCDAYNLSSSDGTVLTTWTNNGSGGTVSCTGTVNTNILNSQRVVTFSTSATWGPNTNVNLSSYSMFFVGRQTGGTNRRVLQDSTTNQLFGYWSGYKKALYIDGDPEYLVTTSSDTSWDMFSHTRVASGAYIFNWNGSLLYSASSSSSSILTNPNINQGGSWAETSDCQVAEIIIYNSVLDSTQVAKVEGYLAWKWGLVANLPSDHPYKNSYPVSSFSWSTGNLSSLLPYSITVSSDGTKLAGVNTVNNDYIYISTDSGATWQTTSSPQNFWSCIKISSDGNTIIAAGSSGIMYKSTNGGSSWTQLTNAPSVMWYCLAISSDASVIIAAVFGGYIYTSTNSGTSWTMRTGCGSRTWFSIACSSDGTKIAGAAGYEGPNIYISTNSGATWTTTYVFSTAYCYSVTMSSDGTKLVVGSSYGDYVYTSSNSGASWTQRTQPGTGDWTSVASSSDGSVIVAAAVNSYVYLSYDSGETWEQQTSGIGIGVWGSTAISSNGAKVFATSIYTPLAIYLGSF